MADLQLVIVGLWVIAMVEHRIIGQVQLRVELMHGAAKAEHLKRPTAIIILTGDFRQPCLSAE